MKKTIVLSLIWLFGLTLPEEMSAKVFLYKIDNSQGIYFVTIQSTDGPNIIRNKDNDTPIHQLQYTLQPGQIIPELKDFAIPSIDDAGRLEVIVRGVNAEGGSFVKQRATLQEQNNEIVVTTNDTNEPPLILATDKNRSVTINRDGKIIVE